MTAYRLKKHIVLTMLAVPFLAVSPAMGQNIDAQSFGFDDELVGGNIKFSPFNYTPPPINMGSFRVSPQLRFEQTYTDNVLATETQAKSDFVSKLTPSIKAFKDQGRHRFGAQARAEITKAWDQSSEDTVEHFTGLAALFEATRSFKIPFSASYQSKVTPRENQRVDFNELTTNPVESTLAQIQTGFILKPNRFSLQLLGEYEQRRFINDSFVNGDTAIFDDRDYDTTQLEAEFAYETKTDWRPFIRFTGAEEEYLRRTYTDATNGYSGVLRDNTLVRALLGTDFDFKGLIYGDFAVGWENRAYDDPAVEDAKALSLVSQINWEPIEKSKITLNLAHQTSEDNIISAGIKKRIAALFVDYELQHDLFARASALYQNEDFVESDREDSTFEAGLELKYFLTPQLQFGGEYRYKTRDSNQIGSSFDQNSLIFKFTSAL